MTSPDVTAGATGGGAAPQDGQHLSRPRLSRQRLIDIWITLVRRELWEHRALWMAPLVVSGLLILCALPPHVGFAEIATNTSGDSHTARLTMNWQGIPLDAEQRANVFAMAMWVLTVTQLLIVAIVVNFYLLDCLYAERRDRSILFWKSLPVSDAATVGSKLLVAVVVVPLGAFALALLTNVAFTIVWNLRSYLANPGGLAIWDTGAFFTCEALLLYGLIVAMLWYAPLAAYLLLISAWARRNVFLWASLPPVLAMIAERIAFRTHHLGELVTYRTFGIWEVLGLRHTMEHTAGKHLSPMRSFLPGMLESLHASEVFGNLDVWLGLAAAAAFTYAAIRIRRYRDDT
jgi:ABC-2 type transport system permease protein